MVTSSKHKKNMDLIDSLVFRKSKKNRTTTVEASGDSGDSVKKGNASQEGSNGLSRVDSGKKPDRFQDHKPLHIPTFLKIAAGILLLPIALPVIQVLVHIILQLLSLPIVILAILVIIVIYLIKK